MFVCICNAIRDTELRDAVRRCRNDMNADGIYTALGRPPQCRQCIDDADEIIVEERAVAAMMAIPAAAVTPMPLPACG